jgi:hypothetical protein
MRKRATGSSLAKKTAMGIFLHNFRLLILTVFLVTYRKGETFVFLGCSSNKKALGTA